MWIINVSLVERVVKIIITSQSSLNETCYDMILRKKVNSFDYLLSKKLSSKSIRFLSNALNESALWWREDIWFNISIRILVRLSADFGKLVTGDIFVSSRSCCDIVFESSFNTSWRKYFCFDFFALLYFYFTLL